MDSDTSAASTSAASTSAASTSAASTSAASTSAASTSAASTSAASTSAASTSVDSGVKNLNKRRKFEEKDTKKAIIDAMLKEVALFGTLISSIVTEPKRTDEDYRRLYLLYRAAMKALDTLKMESNDLQNELVPLPTHAEKVLKLSDSNVMGWSQYFYKNPSPTKIKRVNTIPSPSTERIGSLLHSIGSFFGLTAEAVCSNKRTNENIENMNHLLEVSEKAINDLEKHRDDIEETLKPFIIEKRNTQNVDPITD